MSQAKPEPTVEDLYALLVDVHALVIQNNNILKTFETKVADLEEKLPALTDGLASNPMLKPFMKMLGI